jgi:mRNA-degrading endonuclease RelE of RelBE toxin-antitoxin system
VTPLRIEWNPRALREAKRLDPPTRQRIADALGAFAETERGDIVLLTDVRPPEYRL